jgi:hypothetical protein
MLGIDESLLPADFAEGRGTASEIAERQFRPSPHGRA